MSPYPIPCVNRPKQSGVSDNRGEDDWVSDINRLLRFNASFTGRGMTADEEDEPQLLSKGNHQ